MRRLPEIPPQSMSTTSARESPEARRTSHISPSTGSTSHTSPGTGRTSHASPATRRASDTRPSPRPPSHIRPSVRRTRAAVSIALFALLATLVSSVTHAADPIRILNVSYDPTRELYQEYNPLFTKYWLDKTGQVVEVQQSHGGSGKQARSVIDGLEADVVTLALGIDVDAIVQHAKAIAPDWQSRLPERSAPYTSTIVFLVRKGNPKGIQDWGDLIKDGVEVITPNPKTSGGARWNYLAGWAWALRQPGGNEETARQYITELFKHVPVLDTGARGSTTTFAERGIGDVLLAWENEAWLALEKLGKNEFEIVVPSVSILAEPTVAWVDQNVKRRKTAEIAKAYLEYLYSPEAQEVVARNYYRPRDPEVAAKYRDRFPETVLVTIDDDFGGWAVAQKKHFDDGGIFDQLYGGKKR